MMKDSLALNPDSIPAQDQGSHRGHRVRRVAHNRFRCLDCKADWRMKKNKAIARRKLLR